MNTKIRNCLNYIREITDFTPKVALVLGSGLGGYSRELASIECVIPYQDLPGFPVSTVPGHAGKLIMGHIHGVPVVCLDGRVHFYEGYQTEQVVMPIRIVRAMGAEIILLSNAAGGLNINYSPGSIVMIRDHISLFVRNPLIGPNDPDQGERFPDMTEVYDPELRKLIHAVARKEDIYIESGVYCQVTGPSYETPAEINLLHILGVDLVGMSTVMEAIAAKHIGMRVCALSLVTNMAAGMQTRPLSHEEVREEGVRSASRFAKLVTAAIKEMKDI